VNYADIEGVWTYIYYSHSVPIKRVVGFVKYGAEGQPQRIQMDVSHPVAQQLTFVLGGTNLNRYPGFNGQFSGVVYSTKDGAFVDNLEQLNAKIPKPEPSSIWDRR